MVPAMARAPRLLLALVLCATPWLSGCKTGPQLTQIQAPAAGVSLRYDLTPGQVYKGSVRHNETIRSSNTSNSSSNHFSFDLTLVVRGPDAEHGGNHVTARFSAVTVRWTPPPGLPVSPAEMNKKASDILKGLEVDFSVDESGKISHMPELPDEFPADARPIVQEALDKLETAFLAVPGQALKQGDKWADEKKRGRKGKLGRYIEGTVQSRLEGFYKTGGDKPIEVAKLMSDENETEVTTTAAGGHEVKKRGSMTALFATDQRFLVSYTADRQFDDLGNTNTFIKTEVSWEKVPSQTTPAGPPKQVQDISDPCHADYVGAEECVEPAAPAGGDAPAPAP